MFNKWEPKHRISKGKGTETEGLPASPDRDGEFYIEGFRPCPVEKCVVSTSYVEVICPEVNPPVPYQWLTYMGSE